MTEIQYLQNPLEEFFSRQDHSTEMKGSPLYFGSPLNRSDFLSLLWCYRFHTRNFLSKKRGRETSSLQLLKGSAKAGEAIIAP